MTAAVEARELTKRFGKITAVDSVSLTVTEGERFGFLGPNGSGKTTTIRMLLGLVYPTSGSASLLGSPVPSGLGGVLPQVGALVEGPAAYGHLSGRANLSINDAAGRGGPARSRTRRVEDALEMVGLAGIDKRPVKAYSLGMRQRLGLASALLRKPRLLILDEPTNGLDPQGIAEIRELLIELNRQGTTLLVSSHLLAEVEMLCTRIAVLDRGRLVLEQDLEELHAPTGRAILRTPDVELAARILDRRLIARDGDQLTVVAPDTATLTTELVKAGVRVAEMAREIRSLEDVVLTLTTHGSDRIETP
jgi:ABC-type multidrug transport system ATPase subunit